MQVSGNRALLLEIGADDARIDAVTAALVHVAAVVAEQGHLAVLEFESNPSAAAPVRLEFKDSIAGPQLLGEVEAELRLGEGRLELRTRERGEGERSANMNGGLHGERG